jgi:asparagine synthase (glutamine-hydrolysing)
MDQPSCDGVNTYVVSRAARAAGLVVALGGTGADELHGAYGHADNLIAMIRIAQRLGSLSRPLGRAASALVGAVRGPVAGERLRLMLEQTHTPWRMLQERRRFFTPTQIAEFWPDGRAIPTRWQPPIPDESVFGMLPDGMQITIAEIRGYLLNTLLRDSDWATMANQQEYRVPYLGRRYVEFMLQVPETLTRPRGAIKKPLLADLISPANRALVNLPKRGFSMNYAELLLGPLSDEFHAGCAWLNVHLGFELDAAKCLEGLRSKPSGKLANRLWALFALGSYFPEQHAERAALVPGPEFSQHAAREAI